MPAECFEDINEMLRYSHSLPYDPREWRESAATSSKKTHQKSRRNLCQVSDWMVINVDSLRDAAEVDRALCIEIERAEGMLENADDRDEDAAVFSRETLDRAVEFLKAQSAKLRKMYGSFAPVPHIGPGPDESVDLHWKRESWELLVNIPANPDRLATFYGDDYGAQKIKGSLDPRTINYG